MQYLSVEDVAKIARVPVATVRGWIRTGRLPSVKPGWRRLVQRADIERFLKRSTHPSRALSPSRRALVLVLLAQLDRHARFLRRTLLLLSPDVPRQGFPRSEYEHFERRIRRLIESRFEARIRRSLARAGFRHTVRRHA